jgi:hypothetical protein
MNDKKEKAMKMLYETKEWAEHKQAITQLLEIGDSVSFREFNTYRMLILEQVETPDADPEALFAYSEMDWLVSNEQWKAAHWHSRYMKYMCYESYRSQLTEEQVNSILSEGPKAVDQLENGRLTFGRDHDFWWHRGQIVLPRLSGKIEMIQGVPKLVRFAN